MSIKNNELKNKLQRFAEAYIAGYPRLDELTRFPEDIRQQMIAQKLYGVAVDPQFSGYGRSLSALLHAGKLLVEYGGNMGVAMSWMVHEMISSWLIMRHAGEVQKEIYLPLLATGKKIACFAVSEPKAGAHPKHLKTVAEKVTGGYCLNGEKTYLTNGPMADLFIVIAITGQVSGKNQFTAFLIPRESQGLTVTGPIDFPFLRPCPHGGIRLTDCMVKAQQVIGSIGNAYTEMVLPFRTVEDTLMTGLVSGGVDFLFNHLVKLLKQEKTIIEERIRNESAKIQYTVDTLEVISIAAADMLEQDHNDDRLISMNLFFRTQACETLKGIKHLIDQTGLTPDHQTTSMINDLSAIMRIGENTSTTKLQKLGQSLFSD